MHTKWKKWHGSYRDRKWWIPIAFQLLTIQGYSGIIRFPNACVDTGSPYAIVPGWCPNPCPNEKTLPGHVTVTILADLTGKRIKLNLLPRLRERSFGGIGGIKRAHYVFYADMDVEGFDHGDLISVVFLDPKELRHPIISLTETVERGHAITFSNKGFRVQ